MHHATKRRTANITVKVLKLLLEHAIDIGELEINPIRGMRLKGTGHRDTVWTQDEIDRVVSYLDENGWLELAAAVRVAEYFGLDVSQIAELKLNQYDGAMLYLNRRKKTGNYLPDVTVLPTPKALLDRCTALSKERGSIFLISHPTLTTGWRRDGISKTVKAAVRALKLRPELQFRDLRRTAYVRLIEAGCSEAEATAITGHNIEHGKQILEVYGPRTDRMANNAMAKLHQFKSNTAKEKSRSAATGCDTLKMVNDDGDQRNEGI